MEMGFWSQLGAVLIAAFVIWLLYRYVKHNPESLKKENIMKSMGTMGFLALGLIAFVAFLIFLVNN